MAARFFRSEAARHLNSEKESLLAKRAGCGCARDSLLKERCFMQREIFRRRVLSLIGTIVYVHLGAFSAAAQEPSPTQHGLITTFAPIVEKVAPSVVTVFTTQTISRGQTAFPFGDDTLRQFFGGQLPQRQGKQTLQGLGSGVI